MHTAWMQAEIAYLHLPQRRQHSRRALETPPLPPASCVAFDGADGAEQNQWLQALQWALLGDKRTGNDGICGAI